MEFKENLRNFKPRQSVLEMGIVQNDQKEKSEKFQRVLKQQIDTVALKVEREKYEVHVKQKMEEHEEVLIQKKIELAKKEAAFPL